MRDAGAEVLDLDVAVDGLADDGPQLLDDPQDRGGRLRRREALDEFRMVPAYADAHRVRQGVIASGGGELLLDKAVDGGHGGGS